MNNSTFIQQLRMLPFQFYKNECEKFKVFRSMEQEKQK